MTHPKPLSTIVKFSELVKILESLGIHTYFCSQIRQNHPEYYIAFHTVLKEEFPLVCISKQIDILRFDPHASKSISDLARATRMLLPADPFSSSILRYELVKKLRYRLETSGDRLMISGTKEELFASDPTIPF